MRFLHLIRPVMCVLPEVASPDRKVRRDHGRETTACQVAPAGNGFEAVVVRLREGGAQIDLFRLSTSNAIIRIFSQTMNSSKCSFSRTYGAPSARLAAHFCHFFN